MIIMAVDINVFNRYWREVDEIRKRYARLELVIEDELEQMEFWENHVRCFHRNPKQPKVLCKKEVKENGLCWLHNRKRKQSE